MSRPHNKTVPNNNAKAKDIRFGNKKKKPCTEEKLGLALDPPPVTAHFFRTFGAAQEIFISQNS